MDGGRPRLLDPLLHQPSLPKELTALGDGAEATARTTEGGVDTASSSWPPCKVSAHPRYSRKQRLAEGRLGPRGVWVGTGIVTPVRTELTAAGVNGAKGARGVWPRGAGTWGRRGPPHPREEVTLSDAWPGLG